jgi:hypothetical protein
MLVHKQPFSVQTCYKSCRIYNLFSSEYNTYFIRFISSTLSCLFVVASYNVMRPDCLHYHSPEDPDFATKFQSWCIVSMKFILSRTVNNHCRAIFAMLPSEAVSTFPISPPILNLHPIFVHLGYF